MTTQHIDTHAEQRGYQHDSPYQWYDRDTDLLEHPRQDRFISFRERTVTQEEAEKNKVEVGWYSKEDMAKVLHWNPTLDFQLIWIKYVDRTKSCNHCSIFDRIGLIVMATLYQTWFIIKSNIDCYSLESVTKEKDRWCNQGMWTRSWEFGKAWQMHWTTWCYIVYEVLGDTFSYNTWALNHRYRNNRYGGEEEYYIQTREHGSVEQNKISKDKTKQITKDSWLATGSRLLKQLSHVFFVFRLLRYQHFELFPRKMKL